MEIGSSSRSHYNMSSSGGRGDDDDNNNHNNNRGKKPLLQQQKENQPSKVRKSKGRRRIQIRRIMSEQARLSTFSKRRTGLYKKADNIATRCGCQIGVVGITPANRTFAFGNPNVETVIHRFLQQHPPDKQGIDLLVETIVEAHRRARVDLLNTNRTILEEQLEEERLKSQGLTEINRPFTNGNPNDLYWWDLDNEDEMSDAQIEAAAHDLPNAFRLINDFRQIVLQEHNNLMMPPPPPPPQPQPPVFEYSYEGESSSQALQVQAAAEEMMMMMMDTDTVMEDPSSSSSYAAPPVAAPADPSSSSVAALPTATVNRDEEMDEEELMFLRFFGDLPSSPPGPF